MIKFAIAVLFIISSATSLQAQRLATPEVYPSRAELVAQYQLDEAQQTELDRILLQREQNLEELGRFTNQDAETFWMKRRSLYFGELTSIRLILNRPEQLEAFNQQRVTVRMAESERVRALMAEGHQSGAAKILMLERY